MPAFTPLRQHPFPVPSDGNNVPSSIEALARSVDSVTGSETIRRYISVAERDALNPVPQVGQRCFCMVPTTGHGMEFVGRNGAWHALGMCVYHSKATTQAVTADTVWQLVTYPVSFYNVASSYNGSTWTAPYLGFVRVTAGFLLGIGGGATTLGDFEAHIGVSHAGSTYGGDAFYGRFAQVGMKLSTVLSVSPGNTVSVQVNATAAGQPKTIYSSPNDITGLLIEYI